MLDSLVGIGLDAVLKSFGELLLPQKIVSQSLKRIVFIVKLRRVSLILNDEALA